MCGHGVDLGGQGATLLEVTAQHRRWKRTKQLDGDVSFHQKKLQARAGATLTPIFLLPGVPSLMALVGAMCWTQDPEWVNVPFNPLPSVMTVGTCIILQREKWPLMWTWNAFLVLILTCLPATTWAIADSPWPSVHFHPFS